MKAGTVTNVENARALLHRAELVCSRADVERALDRVAAEIKATLCVSHARGLQRTRRRDGMSFGGTGLFVRGTDDGNAIHQFPMFGGRDREGK